MPMTVPRRPTNGAVAPTEASTGRPDCMRLITVSAVLCRDSVIHSLVPIAPESRVLLVSWYSYACLPVSASARNGFELPFSLLIASVRLEDDQNSRSAAMACRRVRRWSKNLVIMMNHVSSDMINRMTRNDRAIMSPFAISAPRPYGLSTAVSFIDRFPLHLD